MDNVAGQVAAQNPMLGSQLVSKSIVSPAKSPTPSTATSTSSSKARQQVAINGNNKQQVISTAKKESPKAQEHTDTAKRINQNGSAPSTTAEMTAKVKTNASTVTTKATRTIINNNNNCHSDAANSAKLKNVICQTQEAQLQQVEHHALEAGANGPSNQPPNQGGLSARDSELLTKEAQELKIRTRKLQLEIEEKNEIINVLKEELETFREQSDKYQRENLQLVKDAKRVKFLQDENDFLQDKVGAVEKLELEIKRLKEKLNELDFLKLRIVELEEDRNKAQEESVQFEDKWRKAEAKLTRVGELETELNKWKSFSQELEQERDSIQSKLLESIEQESRLNSNNKKVEDEVKRLRDLIKSYEEQRDEEQASNSLIMSVADFKQYDQQHLEKEQKQNSDLIGPQKIVDLCEREQQTDNNDFSVDKSIETDPCFVHEFDHSKLARDLIDENKNLREKLDMQECRLNDLCKTNKTISDELEGNRKLISDLRQDLACEKSFAQKLTTQLASVTKQIKSLDKNYLPLRQTSGSSTKNFKNIDKSDQSSPERPDCGNNSSPLKSVTTIEQQQQHQRAKENDKGASSFADNLTSNRAIELTSNSVKRNDRNGRAIGNETMQQADSKRGTNLEAPAAEAFASDEANFKFNKSEDELCRQSFADSADFKEVPSPASGSKMSSIAGNLLKIAIEQPASSEEGTVNSASAIVANKSTALERAISADDKLAQGKSAFMAARNNSSNKLGSLTESATLPSSGSPEQMKSQTLFPSKITDGQGGSMAKGSYVDKSIDNNLKINNNHYQAIVNRSDRNSISSSSSVRSQSSSPSSVAVTLGHDSGFQSINHGK